MRITVHLTPTPGRGGSESHTADWVDHDTAAGELLVTRRDEHGRTLGWTLYAAGEWRKVAMDEPPSPDVLRRQAQSALRDRTPPNSGPTFPGALS